MTDNSISERMKQVIVEHLGVEEDAVVDEATFADDLGADSLDALDLLLAVNEEFGTRIPAEKLPELHTVKQMVEVVEAALGTTGS